MRLKKLFAIAAFGLLTLVPFAAPANAQPVVSGTFVGPHGAVTFSNGGYYPRNDFGYSTYYSHPRYGHRYGYAGYYGYPRGRWEYRRFFVEYPWPHWVTRRVWISYRY